MSVAAEAYNGARWQLTQANQRIDQNRREMRATTRDLKASRAELASRLRTLYATRQPSLIEVVLASGSITTAYDQLAMLVMRDLASLQLAVPRDVSVAGFDGVSVGGLTAPALSTVMQPSPQIAATAVDLLLKLIGGERFLAPALLHHTLRLGESTAPPPQPSCRRSPTHTTERRSPSSPP